MNPTFAERVIQLLSVPGIWLAFLAAWWSTGRHRETWNAQGADLPEPTLMWVAFAGNEFAFVVPALCTLAVIGLMRTRSTHANWLSGATFALALAYALASQAAAILPMIKPCSAT